MKKLLTILIAAASVALLSLLVADDNTDHLTKETMLSGKDALVAKQFTHFIHDYAKNNRIEKFKKRFRYIPPENAHRVWKALVSINKISEPVKITIPATGKTRRCVYYRKDDNRYYKFVVNNSKKQWLFQEFSEVKVNN